MDISLEKLSYLRAQNIWLTTLNNLFKKVSRQIYHQYFEKMQPVYLWEGRFILKVYDEYIHEVQENYNQILLENLRESSKSIKTFELLKMSETITLDFGENQDVFYGSQYMDSFWEKVLDQYPTRSDKNSYEIVRKWVNPLAIVDKQLVISINKYSRVLKNIIYKSLLPCVQSVDATIKDIEFVQITKIDQKNNDSSEVAPVLSVRDNPEPQMYNSVWKTVLGDISKKISRPSFETWIQSAEFVSYKNGIFTIKAANNFSRDWLENRYKMVIIDSIRKMNLDINKLEILSVEEEEQSVGKLVNANEDSNSIYDRLDRIEDQLESISKMLKNK